MNHLERLQRIAVAIAALGGCLGLASSAGCNVLPAAPPSLTGILHLLFLCLGAGAGWLTALSHRQVEHQRWQAVTDPLVTKGEREYAHKEAESQRRFAGTAFLLAPMGLAFWLASHFDKPGKFVFSDLFLVSPLLGFVLGLIVAHLAAPPKAPPSAP